ncbi:MAG TPA: TonB family protein [Povalibacter sp.]
MQRRQHDAKFSALNTGIRGADAVDVVVLSDDESLLVTLQEAAGTTNAIWHAPSADAAVDLLVGGHCSILIADLNVLRSDAAGLLERLQSQFPELVLLATGRRDEEGAVAGLISKGSVYRFLHKPVSPARANLFLATATRRYRELVPTTSPALATVRQFTRSSNRPALIGGVAVALLLLVAAGLYLRRGTPEKAPTDAAPIVAAPLTTLDVTSELAAAQQALVDGRLVAPADDNALARFRAILAIEAGNPAAAAGVQKILGMLEGQLIDALQRRDAPAASRAFSALQAADPAHADLASLRDQLLALSRTPHPESTTATKVAAPAASKTPSAVAQTPNVVLARARLASGQWLEPENDNALFYLRQAQSLGENSTVISIAATDLGSRLVNQSREAIAAGNADQARTAFSAAIDADAEFNLALSGLAEVGRQLDDIAAASTKATNKLNDTLASIIKLRESGQLIAPAGNNAFEALRPLMTQYPDSREVRAEQQRLVSALLENARTAFAAADLDRAELLTTRADQVIPGMSATQSLRQQINASRATQAAAAQVVNAGNLQRTREIPAVYPPDARRREIEGWVELEFVVATDGSVDEVIVRNSQPAGTFDRAATDAIRRWRFEPVLRDGAPVAQRAQLRMQFSLK